MFKKTGIFICIVFLISSCTSQNSNLSKEKAETPAEIVSYSKEELELANLLLTQAINKNNGVVIIKNTLTSINPARKDYIKKEFPDIDNVLIQNFFNINSTKQALDTATIFDTDFIWYEQFRNENLDANGKIDIYNVINNKITNFNGIIELTRIGFNTDKTQAMVLIGIQKSMWSGFGDYLILEKKDSKWNVIKVIHDWIS